MSTKVTRTQLNNLVRQICDLTGLSNSRDEAEKKGQTEFLNLDYDPTYGGYSIEMMDYKTWCPSEAFSNSGRYTAFEMRTLLKGIIAGLCFAKRAKNQEII